MENENTTTYLNGAESGYIYDDDGRVFSSNGKICYSSQGSVLTSIFESHFDKLITAKNTINNININIREDKIEGDASNESRNQAE